MWTLPRTLLERSSCNGRRASLVLGLESGEEDLEYKDKVAEGAGGLVGVLGHDRELVELHFGGRSGLYQSAQDDRA